MLNLLKIEDKKNILETAVGPGIQIPHLIHRKHPEARIVLTDLATEFLAITQKRLELFEQNPFQNLYDLDTSSLQKFSEPVELSKFSVRLEEANAESMP